ncbi:MAG TPA: helix-turn-helix domain-containing protein, partial [Armatimonadota bacterium]|nr:helix-turn-helix domain-containing protein [Armatimonadota bacterium]
MVTEEKKPPVQSVERALDILDLLADSRSAMRAADIAAALELHPNTAHNIIRTLFRRGYLLQQDDNRYALGPRCYQIGMRCNPWEQLR